MKIPGRRLWRRSRATLRAKPLAAIPIVVALMAGAAIGTVPGDVAYKYAWVDYRFCDDCHIHDYANEAYERSVHFGLTTCHDCHRVPIRHYPKNLYKAIFVRPDSPDDIPVPDVGAVICDQCHSSHGADEPLTGPMSEEVRQLVVKIDDSPLHQVHLNSETRDPGPYLGHHASADDDAADDGHGEEAATGHGEGGEHEGSGLGVIECVDCHGGRSARAHHFEAIRENCIVCHGDFDVTPDSRLAAVSCQQCHFWGFAGTAGTAAADASPPDDGAADADADTE